MVCETEIPFPSFEGRGMMLRVIKPGSILSRMQYCPCVGEYAVLCYLPCCGIRSVDTCCINDIFSLNDTFARREL